MWNVGCLYGRNATELCFRNYVELLEMCELKAYRDGVTDEELKYKLEEMGSNDASEEALELLEAAVTREQNNKENNQ